MLSKKHVINANPPLENEDEPHVNYQLIRSDFLESDSEKLVDVYSIVANYIVDNRITESYYASDVSRDREQASKIFETLVQAKVRPEFMVDMLEELII